jgi:cytoskeletal protein CcmA (bactofilin family)
MGKNAKGDQAIGDVTADHTPQSPAAYATSNAPVSSHSEVSGNSNGSNNGSNGSSYYQPAAQTPSVTRAVTESESLAREIKEGTLSGFVGNGTMLTGEATFKGMLRVDGHLSGRVNSQDGTLIVSSNGQVDANIEVAVAQIYGTVNGDVIATKRIEMGRVARVTGNIQTPALVIENGAIFEGSCRMVQVKEAEEKRRKEEDQRVSYSSGAPLMKDPIGEEVADVSEVAS